MRHRRRRVRDMSRDDAHLQWRKLHLRRDDVQLRYRLLQRDELSAWNLRHGLWHRRRGVRGLRNRNNLPRRHLRVRRPEVINRRGGTFSGR